MVEQNMAHNGNGYTRSREVMTTLKTAGPRGKKVQTCCQTPPGGNPVLFRDVARRCGASGIRKNCTVLLYCCGTWTLDGVGDCVQ